jgi:hypothetical protein
MIPVDALVYIAPEPEADARFVEVRWRDRVVSVFVKHLNHRGEPVETVRSHLFGQHA